MKHILSLITALSLSFTLQAIKPSQMAAHDASTLPLLGTLAPDASKSYSRLPDSLKDSIRTDLWELGKHSAGLAVRFRSDASAIGARWKSTNKFNMNHMTATGIRGVDLYVLDDDSTWTPVASGRPSMSSHNNASCIMENMEPRMREYMLYLSLYDGVDSLYVLTDSAARVLPPAVDLPRRDHPMVMYGTSILQGGCASRPGMVHTSVLGRMFNREVINLGFSGNARLDPEIARLMAGCDASVYVLDMLPNCTADILESRLEPFVAILRASRPDVPIPLVESPMFPAWRFNSEVRTTLTHKNDVLRAIYRRLAATDPHIYYMSADRVLDNVEATVDNYHYTDLGFSRFAEAMKPVLETIIGPAGR